MSDAYIRQYNEIVVSEAVEYDKVEGQYPFHRSTWKNAHTRHINMQETCGDLLRSTFLSGGSMYLSHSMYQESFETKAVDISNGCILTDAEVAHNCEGIRLFFELDYRTSEHPLPSFEEALIHLRVLYRTVLQCFPHLGPVVMHIASCTPKRKQRKSANSVELAWGIHVVFPSIVTTTPTMKLIAQLTDTRISNLFPRWNNIVDPASYRSSSATLRPCFSFKWVECPICSINAAVSSGGGARSATKRRRMDTEESIESLFRMQLSDSCSCFSGHKVDPSIYTYSGSLDRADGALVQLVQGVKNVLTEMSITPHEMGVFTDGFFQPEDMGDAHDIIPRSDTISSKCRAVNSFQRRKDNSSLELGEYPSGCQTILGILKRVHLNYRFLAIHKIMVDKKQRSFLITVKGSGSRFCMSRNAVHNSNKIYFCIDVKRARIRVHCYDPDCKRDHGKARVERALTLVDKYSLSTQFGLASTLTRRTISPSTGEEIVPLIPLVPVVQISDTETKKLIWEEKQRMYQSTIGGK
jgi:hypothetical protein